MATKNPRVVGYIQPDTHAKLKHYMEQNNVSESKALDLILGEYFGVDVPRVTVGSTPDVDSKINEAIAPLQRQIDELAELRSLLMSSSKRQVNSANEELSLNQADLAKRLGCDAATVSRKRGREDFTNWSRERDPERKGWQYLSKQKVFVSIDEGEQDQPGKQKVA